MPAIFFEKVLQIPFAFHDSEHEQPDPRFRAIMNTPDRITLILASLLLGGRAVLEYLSAPIPTEPGAMFAWVESHYLALALSNEALGIGAVLLIPGIAGIFRALYHETPSLTISGCGIFAAAVPLMLMACVVQGRLVYPVSGITANTADNAALTLALFYGGMHMIALMFGVAILLIGLAARKLRHGTVFLGVGVGASGAAFLAGYPDSLGAELTLACWLIVSLWFLFATRLPQKSL